MTDEDLSAIRAREQAVPKEPWKVAYSTASHRPGSPACVERCGTGLTPDSIDADGSHVFIVHESVEDVVSADDTHVICTGHDYDDYGYISPEVAEFTAHARTDIPALLAEVEHWQAHAQVEHAARNAAEAEVEKLRDALRTYERVQLASGKAER